MNELVIDTEVTTHAKGNPYSTRNHAVCYSYSGGDGSGALQISGDAIEYLQERIRQADVLVFFNAKFDLTWLRKLGINYDNKRIWCCQVAEFLLEYQRVRYPSLEDASVKYGLGHKIDVVKEEYWNKGINTDEIPWTILSTYAEQDAILTHRVYQRQQAEFKKRSPTLNRLMQLEMHDLLILLEMEWNGLKYDPELCATRSADIEEEIRGINSYLSSIYPDVSINFNSGDQLSAFLYGGKIVEERKVPNGFWKSGKKAGEVRYRTEEVEHVLPRLFDPIEGSKLQKEGYWQTSEDILKVLKGTKKSKEIIDKILTLGKLEKLNGTYYKGVPKLCAEMSWEGDIIHGQFNQVVAQTGRLSAIKPNQQNFDPGFQQTIVSRYATQL